MHDALRTIAPGGENRARAQGIYYRESMSYFKATVVAFLHFVSSAGWDLGHTTYIRWLYSICGVFYPTTLIISLPTSPILSIIKPPSQPQQLFSPTPTMSDAGTTRLPEPFIISGSGLPSLLQPTDKDPTQCQKCGAWMSVTQAMCMECLSTSPHTE